MNGDEDPWVPGRLARMLLKVLFCHFTILMNKYVFRKYRKHLKCVLLSLSFAYVHHLPC